MGQSEMTSERRAVSPASAIGVLTSRGGWLQIFAGLLRWRVFARVSLLLSLLCWGLPEENNRYPSSLFGVYAFLPLTLQYFGHEFAIQTCAKVWILRSFAVRIHILQRFVSSNYIAFRLLGIPWCRICRCFPLWGVASFAGCLLGTRPTAVRMRPARCIANAPWVTRSALTAGEWLLLTLSMICWSREILWRWSNISFWWFLFVSCIIPDIMIHSGLGHNDTFLNGSSNAKKRVRAKHLRSILRHWHWNQLATDAWQVWPLWGMCNKW